jgi:hypothetical protein
LQKEPHGDRPGGSFYSLPSSAPTARRHKTVIAEAISGNNSTSINSSRLCEVLCGDQIQQHRPERRDSRHHIEHGPDHCR